MEKEAKHLVELFLESAQNDYTNTYSVINKDGTATGENILLLVIKTTPQRIKSLKEYSALVQKAVAGPKGTICPLCQGTGKV